MPIVLTENSIQKDIERYVRTIMSDNNTDQNVQESLDLIVYKLYDLTYKEVLIVDPETPISQEEYENFLIEWLNNVLIRTINVQSAGLMSYYLEY